MTYYEARQYLVPYFDCPACGEVNDGIGRDELASEEECISCGETIAITR